MYVSVKARSCSSPTKRSVCSDVVPMATLMPSPTRVLRVGRAEKMPEDRLLSVTMRSCTRRWPVWVRVTQTVLISQ